MNKIIVGILVLIIGLGVYTYFTNGGTEQVLETATTTPEIKVDMVSEPAININEVKNMNIVMKTNKGDIELVLFGDDAPKTVANFTKLASEGFYDGTKFHRVIKGFMIQGGDPLSKDDAQAARWGTGGPGYSFEDEIHANNVNAVGTIAMANSGPNTNGSQFFINVSDNNFLDLKHTVFGRVVNGMDVVSAIENTPTGEADRPLEPMIIESIEIIKK